MMKVASLVLGAGQSKRFGQSKLIYPINGVPVLQDTLEKLHPLFKDDLFCVLGAYYDQTEPIAKSFSKTIYNPEWQSGMGSSIAHGIRYIMQQDQYDYILLALADQIALSTHDYEKLLCEVNIKRDTMPIIAAQYNSMRGVPVLFPKQFFENLLCLKGDQGARKLIKEHKKNVIPVPLEKAAFDLDTPEDLHHIKERNLL